MSRSSDNDPRLTALAARLPATVPFVGPEAQERAAGVPFKARLGANENAFGASPEAVRAMRMAIKETWMYGDPESHDLRNALAVKHGVAADEIVVGAGIDGLLDSLVRLTVTEGTPVVTSAGAYPTFNYHVTGYGGVIHTVNYTADHEDPDHLVAKAREVGAKLIYLSNPDNPMGTWHTAGTLKQMIQSIPDGCLLVLDEAYVELGPNGIAPPINTADERVIRLRTFSKAYGMAGARVGYAIGPKRLISAFNRVRNHFGMSRVSQAGALAALEDVDWLEKMREKVLQARATLYQIAEDNDLKAVPSATNFVAIDCGGDGDFARAVLASLIEQGVFVRMPFVAPQDRCIRVSCGPNKDMKLFAKALPKALVAAKDSAQKV
ncbi:pyridoxal phosphate-dependent aminotransferase [Octadecabacter sp. 1_MG-2023]|uniref:pyridoxal phosphate-dependent aminotransferase n=1 Tax=unclassified Octadecabacter TaxID=196158 RepID=UPI001C09CB2F|nr:MULTISPECIES: pyridoxal phosphate-dependent aminotransferase [unclassified Octadecabacter]MBU2992660.1 pyridoxal phosphate-dependent aminotransferase [Octadecabacter sp. B2R22]MDO6733889.1 pyridoxal phosphate-dependent aminotransferase [Octadecabacter sp. 1_MG-2023]